MTPFRRGAGISALIASLSGLVSACAPAPEPAAPPRPPPATVERACPTAQTVTKAPEAAPLPSTFDVDAIDRYLAHEVKAHGLVGLSVAIMRHGELALLKGYGASAVGGAPVGEDTAFAIGSVTKQFTCAAVLLLADEGKLDPKDPVAKYYPGLTRAKDVTLYDLLTHTSGYRDYYPLDFVDRSMAKPIAPDALVRQFAGAPLDFEPGTRWSYSNTGFVLAGRVVEKVGKEPLGAFFAHRIFEPLGMQHTAFEPRFGRLPLAQGHQVFALGAAEPVAPEGDGWLDAAGGIASTAGDLMRWDVALIEGKLLKPKSRTLMTTARTLRDGSNHGYGCGLGVTARRGETVLSHTGSVSGFNAYNLVIPRMRSAVVVLSNSESPRAGAIHDELVALVQKADARGGVVIPAVAGPPAELVAKALIAELRAGAVDRTKLGDEFAHYLDEARVRAAAARLGPLGEPDHVDLENTGERGGMEVTSLKITFKTTSARAVLYRTPDGKVQEFLLSEP